MAEPRLYKMKRRSPPLPVVFPALLALLALGCTSRGADEALVLFDVQLAAEVRPFNELRFSSPDGTRRILEAAKVTKNEFTFGYYLTPTMDSMQVTAEAIRSPECLVGRGVGTTPSRLQAGDRAPGGTLRINLVATAPCLVKDAGADAGAVPSGPDAEGDGPGDDGADAEIVDDGQPPTVLAFSPADRAEDADRRAPIVITFSKAIDPASLTGAVTVAVGADRVTGQLSADDGSKTVSFKPEKALPMLAAITVTATTKLRDRQGRALAADRSASFGTADGKWTAAEMLQQHDNQALENQQGAGLALAADPQGNALVAWERFVSLPAADDHRSALHISRFTSGAWATSEELINNKDGRALNPLLAVDAMGRGLLLLSLNTKPVGPMIAGPLVARLFDPAKGWTTPAATVDGHPGGFSSASHLSMLPSGDAFVTWEWYAPSYERSLEGRKFSMGGFGPPQRLDQPPPAGQFSLFISSTAAIDRNGNVMALWSGATGKDFFTAQPFLAASRLTAGKGWSPPVKLTGAIKSLGAFDSLPQVVVDSGGNAIAAWTQATTTVSPDTLLFAYYDARMGMWEQPIEMASKTQVSFTLTSNAGGATLLAFSEKGAVRAARVSSIPQGSAATFTRQGQIGDVQAGLDDRERGVVAWREGEDMVAWRYDRAEFRTPVKLSTAAAVGAPRLQVLPDGRAFVVWVEAKTPNRLMAARFE
jgi:hypothetical protein